MTASFLVGDDRVLLLVELVVVAPGLPGLRGDDHVRLLLDPLELLLAAGRLLLHLRGDDRVLLLLGLLGDDLRLVELVALGPLGLHGDDHVRLLRDRLLLDPRELLLDAGRLLLH